MAEERKYSIVGTVSIGTDEYRDLIEDCAKSARDADDYRSRYWTEQTRANNAEKLAEARAKAVALYNDFVNSSEELKAKYALFLVQRSTTVEE